MNKNKVAIFSKVSLNQFIKDYKEIFILVPKPVLDKYECKTEEEYLSLIWDNIELPIRSTMGSCGYDFMCPIDLTLFKHASVTAKIPTGIRCEIEDGWFLQAVPRSSMGFKYGMKLSNTLGIIDSDYAFAKNEGHIMAKIKIEDAPQLVINRGDKFIQGIFLPYGITIDDEATGIRTGGIGSTTNSTN